MTSEWGQKMHERRHELTTQLIERLLGVPPDDDNYALALDFCLQKEYYHSFGDVNPSAVETFYADVVQRLHEDSQLSKASALSALTTKLLACNLASSTLDLNHNLLQLLASLSGQPLTSSLEETPQLLDLLYKTVPGNQQQHVDAAQQQQQQRAVSRFKQLLHAAAGSDTDEVGSMASGGSTGEPEYDPYGEESDLTSAGWDSDEEYGQQYQQQQEDEQQHTPATSSGIAGPEQDGVAAAADGLALQQAAYMPVAALQPPNKLQPCRTTPQPGELLAVLTAKRVGHLPFLRPDRDHCFSEPYLAAQLLVLLQGHEARGFVLAEPQGGLGAAHGVLQQCFKPDVRVTTPAMSPGALQRLLAEFAAAGSAARQLRKLAQQLTQTRGRAWLVSEADSTGAATADVAMGDAGRSHVGITTFSASAGSEFGAGGTGVTCCLRSFGVALQQQLDLVGQQLVQMQLQHAACPAAEAGAKRRGQAGLTLLAVMQHTRPIMRRLQLLHETVFGVLQQLGGSSANMSAALLDGLYERATAAATVASGVQGVADAAALLHLLLCSCVPLVAALAQWLWGSGDGAAAGTDAAGALGPLGRQLSSLLGCDTSKQQQQQQEEGVNCCCEDFFIIRKAAVAATDARFWHAAYRFSKRRASSSSTNAGGAAGVTSNEGLVACPAFLLPLASCIMTAGKSVRLLDYMEQVELKNTSFASSASSNPAGGSGLGAAGGAMRPPLARSDSAGFAGPTARRSDSMTQSTLKSQGSLQRRPSLTRAPRSSTGGTAAVAATVSAAASGADGAAGGAVAVKAGRRQWGERTSVVGAAAAAGGWAAAEPGVAHLTRQVRLQLAVAAVVAGQQEQEQLAHEFIDAACQLLQRQQQRQQQAEQAWQLRNDSCNSSVPEAEAAAAASTPAELMRGVLEAAGQLLSQPCSSLSDQTGGLGQHQQAQQSAGGLREALLVAKAQRTARKAAVLDSKQAKLHQVPSQQQQQQQQQSQQQQQQDQQQKQKHIEQPQKSHVAVEWHTAVDSPAMPADQGGGGTAVMPDSTRPDRGMHATCGGEVAAAGDAAVPVLLQWRDQLEARLAAAGSCLQRMAPWHQQQQQPSKPQKQLSQQEQAHHSQPDSCVLMRAAGSQMPGSFSGSLAELWPLKPRGGRSAAGAAVKQWGTNTGSGSPDDQQHWLTCGQWPGQQLSWLLLRPPRQLLPLPQLFEQALLQPIQARVDLIGRQLLSSLMGEWGLLQQLQGLVGVFLLASPAMVEWSEGCFAAVEAAAATKRTKSGSSASRRELAGTTGRTAALASGGQQGSGGVGIAGAAGARCEAALGVDELDVFELEVLLQDLVSTAPPDDPLPDPACLHISINTAALTDLRTARQQRQQQQGLATADGHVSAGMGVGGAAATGGLWCCTAEWAGLSCSHSGTWQLSLVYDPQELSSFSMAWRFLLALRWVRRRLDGARHSACKGPAAATHMADQDRREAAAVAAALQASRGGSLQQHNTRLEPGSAGSPRWLSSRQELLLLLEMGQLMARWQQYVMDRLLRGAWATLEQALCSAASLDEVRSAAGCFLQTVSNLCNCRPGGKGGTWRHVGKVLGQLMDMALDAAAASGRLRELRQLLAQPGLEPAAAQRCWLELCGARTRLASSASTWRAECGYLLRILSVRNTSLGDEEDLEALLGALDMNGYYSRLAGINTGSRGLA